MYQGCPFLRIEFICIIWTFERNTTFNTVFLRIEFICIIWTIQVDQTTLKQFLRIEFICIIWTIIQFTDEVISSWGLNLFVLFEPLRLWMLKLVVLEDWIYLYYLNIVLAPHGIHLFLRIEFICIIWTPTHKLLYSLRSWGLNLFVLFELNFTMKSSF